MKGSQGLRPWSWPGLDECPLPKNSGHFPMGLTCRSTNWRTSGMKDSLVHPNPLYPSLWDNVPPVTVIESHQHGGQRSPSKSQIMGVTSKPSCLSEQGKSTCCRGGWNAVWGREGDQGHCVGTVGDISPTALELTYPCPIAHPRSPFIPPDSANTIPA